MHSQIQKSRMAEAFGAHRTQQQESALLEAACWGSACWQPSWAIAGASLQERFMQTKLATVNFGIQLPWVVCGAFCSFIVPILPLELVQKCQPAPSAAPMCRVQGQAFAPHLLEKCAISRLTSKFFCSLSTTTRRGSSIFCPSVCLKAVGPSGPVPFWAVQCVRVTQFVSCASGVFSVCI